MVKVGDIHESKSYGRFFVKHIKNCKSIEIEFCDTGFSTTTRKDKILSGAVKDRLLPTICGVGYVGDGPHKPKTNNVKCKAYQTWRNMLARCYDKEVQKRKPTYIGCKVCDEWHNFQNFAEWYKPRFFYDAVIDKDLSSFGSNGKLYSPETCVMVSKLVNAEEAFAKLYRLKSPNGDIVDVYNLSKFCRDRSLSLSSIHLVATGKQSEHRGWKSVL